MSKEAISRKGAIKTEKMNRADKAKLVFLLLYFLILTVERLISLGAIFTGDFSAYGGLDRYMTVLTILSLIGAYLFIFLGAGLLPLLLSFSEGFRLWRE